MSEMRFKRALLINPPTGLYRRDDRCQCKVEDQTVQITFPPMELAMIAAVLEQSGVTCMVRDYPGLRLTWDHFVEDLKAFRPDFFLVNVVTATAEADFQACVAAKDVLGDGVLVAARGEYMEALGVEAMQTFPEIDFGLHGEVERVVESIAKGEDLAGLKGLLYREPAAAMAGVGAGVGAAAGGNGTGGNGAANGAGSNGASAGTIRRNPGHPVVEDLDALPFPARHLLENERYISPDTGEPLTIIHGNRGCPAHCIFCPAGVMSGFRVRYRTPQNIVEELKLCVSEYGIREFLFHGDTFTMNKKWMIELCDRIVEEGLDIKWGCNSRVDTIDEERAQAMKAAGCWVVAFGLETGNQEILDKLKKGATVEQGRRAVEICKRAGLRTQAFFVIGLPWETEETLEETYRFAREVDPDFFDFNIAYPLPGTEYYEMAVQEGLFEASPEQGSYANAAVRTYTLSSEYLSDWRRKKLLAMYMRPQYVARMLRRAGSPKETLNYMRAGAKRLRQLVMPASV